MLVKALTKSRYWFSNLSDRRFNSCVPLKGQSHEKVGEMRVECDGLGPN
jgi:hypothetical protein